MKPQLANDLIEDLTLLHARLVSLDMDYQNGQVFLADLQELDDPP